MADTTAIHITFYFITASLNIVFGLVMLGIVIHCISVFILSCKFGDTPRIKLWILICAMSYALGKI